MRLSRAVLLWALCAALSGQALAAEELIPIGEPVGIRLDIDGVLVAGTGPVETAEGTTAPAREAGVRAGDVIKELNGVPMARAEELAQELSALDGQSAELTILRGGRELVLTVAPAQEDDGGQTRLGLYLRDGVTGIGTVTYVDPETGSFGALGHGVNDADSGALLPAAGGSVCSARIVDVKPGRPGEPGELAGSFSLAEQIGVIRENTASGIFGVMERSAAAGHEAIPVAAPEEVENGEATILACVDGREAREYRVEIARAGFMTGTGRDLTVRVTDPELLALTGGIVQGMSGSPILQNGKLVGAVTHVLTGDPTRGYGIYAANMQKAAPAA